MAAKLPPRRRQPANARYPYPQLVINGQLVAIDRRWLRRAARRPLTQHELEALQLALIDPACLTIYAQISAAARERGL